MRPARSTALLAVTALLALAACAKGRSHAGPAPAPEAAPDPVEAFEHAPPAASSSAGSEAFEKAFALHDAACKGGDTAACVDLGIDYERGRGVPADPARAVPLYRQGCDAKVAAGCSNLGQLYDRGAGVPKDPLMAARLYRRACDDGSPLGCNNLGLDYKDGVGVDPDDARAARLFDDACERDNADA